MFRRVVSILLLCAVLTSHWAAAVPHSHAGMSPSELEFHSRTPHVHLGRHGHSGHGHSGHHHSGHRHSGHHHTGHDDHSGHSHHFGHVHSICSEDCTESDRLPGGTIPEHDDHVVPIYLGCAVIGSAYQPSVRSATMNGDLFLGLVFSSETERPLMAPRSDEGWGYDQPPECRNHGTSTYLWTRRIRL